MSTNLQTTRCPHCGATPRIEGPIEPVSVEKHGTVRAEQYAGMLVADATCPVCESRFIAWVDERPCAARGGRPLPHPQHPDPDQGPPFFDLSYRSTFNDEPGPDDGPRYDVTWLPAIPLRKPHKDVPAGTYGYTQLQLFELVRAMDRATSQIYPLLCGTNVHPFIEFCGLMNEYIQICAGAAADGVEFPMANDHNDIPLPIKSHQIAYIGEKLRCIFGPALARDPDLRERFIGVLCAHDKPSRSASR